MKKLLSISPLLLLALIISNCSSDSGMSIATHFGKWEAKTVQLEANKTINYSELNAYSKNEVLEIFTDSISSAKLVQYQVGEKEPTLLLGSVNNNINITFTGSPNNKRQILEVKETSMSVWTKIIYNGDLKEAKINYAKIGNPRDKEPLN